MRNGGFVFCILSFVFLFIHLEDHIGQNLGAGGAVVDAGIPHTQLPGGVAVGVPFAQLPVVALAVVGDFVDQTAIEGGDIPSAALLGVEAEGAGGEHSLIVFGGGRELVEEDEVLVPEGDLFAVDGAADTGGLAGIETQRLVHLLGVGLFFQGGQTIFLGFFSVHPIVAVVPVEGVIVGGIDGHFGDGVGEAVTEVVLGVGLAVLVEVLQVVGTGLHTHKHNAVGVVVEVFEELVHAGDVADYGGC